MEISTEIQRHCAGLGFASCRGGELSRAFSLAIFNGLREIAPESPAWIIGHAMLYANCDNDPDAACRFMMEQGVSSASGDLMARAFLSLFLALAKRASQAEDAAKAVIADGSDPEAADFAQSVLDNEIHAVR